MTKKIPKLDEETLKKIPEPQIVYRQHDLSVFKKARSLGVSDVASKIISQRVIPEGIDIEDIINPSLAKMPPIAKLKDVEKAADRISDAIINEEVIGLACDFDVDGISSAAVMVDALNKFFKVPMYNIKVFFSHRMHEGYGFSDKVMERVLASVPRPSLVVTADQGSSNGPTIEKLHGRLKEAGESHIDVIVSDHHHIDSFPDAAYAFVNPQRHDDEFEDKTICGCTVALLLMTVTRIFLIKKGFLSDDAPKLRQLLSYSTAATIADCVSMASPVNRAIVNAGLEEMNSGNTAAWRQLNQFVSDGEPITAETLGFGLGPRINACSRTGGDGMAALKYYISENDDEAHRYLSMLGFVNEERQDIERRLIVESVEKSVHLESIGYNSLVIFLPDGHHGIHGIVASRLVERFGKPAICLSPKEYEISELTKQELFELCPNLRDQDEFDKLKANKDYLFKVNDFEKVVVKKASRVTTKIYEQKTKDGVVVSEKKITPAALKKIKTDVFDVGGKFNFKEYSSTIEEGEYVYAISKTRSIRIVKDKDVVATKKRISVLSGSARSVEGLNLYNCLKEVSDERGLFLGWGGHDMAAGLAIKIERLDEFREHLEKAVNRNLGDIQLGPRVLSDGLLPEGYPIDDEFIQKLQELEPTGNGFEKPTFTIRAKIHTLSVKNETGVFKIIYNGQQYSAAVFKYITHPMSTKLMSGDFCEMVITPVYNYFRGRRSIQFFIHYARKID